MTCSGSASLKQIAEKWLTNFKHGHTNIDNAERSSNPKDMEKLTQEPFGLTSCLSEFTFPYQKFDFIILDSSILNVRVFKIVIICNFMQMILI